MVQKVKQRRLLARSTLLVIIEILQAARPVAGRALAEAADIPSRTVSQILKRLSNEGWLLHNLPSDAIRSGQRRHPIRYRLTVKGRQEARKVLAKQASRVGGRWQIDVPAPVQRSLTQPQRLGTNDICGAKPLPARLMSVAGARPEQRESHAVFARNALVA